MSELKLVDGSIAFHGLKALDGVSLSLQRGEILGLLGPNGSGKTTTLNALSGVLRLNSGQVICDGEDLTKATVQKRVRQGIVRTFQSVKVFERLTVRENILLPLLSRGKSTKEANRMASEIVEELDLLDVEYAKSGSVPAGVMRRIGIARALGSGPKFLLLDEPAAGQNESEAVGLIRIIKSLAEKHKFGVLLVEHDMNVVMQTCDRLHVLDSGRTIAEGLPDEIRKNQKVREVYFGKSM